MVDNIEEIEDRLYYEGLTVEEEKQDGDRMSLPSVVEDYVASATQVSKYNDVPAALTFFTLLGELTYPMVKIVRGRSRDDTRIHFLWMQTSGTGKSEMYNFFGPVAKMTFEMVNATYAHAPITANDVEVKYNIFDVKDITDAALVGSAEKEDQLVEQENGPPRREKVVVMKKGALDGSGLCVYDEFEYSGVFKQSQHKENVIMYLNTLMNTLWGKNYIISKKLKDCEEPIICDSRRGVYATTYIPKDLTRVIAEKGVMQRMLIFIWEVPQYIQDQINEDMIEEVGTVIDSERPIKKFANAFLVIYDSLKKRYEEVGEDPMKTIRYADDFNAALKNEWKAMRNYVTNSRPEVFEIAGNFITRLLGTLTRLSVLCAIAEAPGISDEKKRYIVTAKNVRQASSLVRQCYKSLVSWLDSALKVRRQTLEAKTGMLDFKVAYGECKPKNDEWVSKSVLLAQVRKNTNKGESTIYRHFQKHENKFEKKKIGIKTYLKIKEEENE